MRLEVSVERCGDDPSFCKGYLECIRSDGTTFSMATGRCKTNAGALKELQGVLKEANKNIEFNLKRIANAEKLRAAK